MQIKQEGGIKMGARKVFITKFISVTTDEEVSDQINNAHLAGIFARGEVIAVIVLHKDIELTTGQSHLLQRAFISIFKESISVIY